MRLLVVSSALGASEAIASDIAWSQEPQLLGSRRYSGEGTSTPIGHVGAALLGQDSLVYVLDSENRVIHVANGSKQLRVMSRAGRGPGEMQGASRMSFLGDSIVLPDVTLARVTIFPLKGTPVRTVDVGRASAAGFFGVDPIMYGRAALILLGWNNAERGSDLALFARAHGTSRLDTIARMSRGDVRMDIPVLLGGRSANMPREQPFVTLPIWDFGRDGGGVVVLDTVGQTRGMMNLRVRQWSNSGRLVRTCTITRRVQPLTNAAYEAGLLTLGPPPSGRAVVKVDWNVVRRVVIRPSTLPPYRGVRLASDGTVWIRTEASLATDREEYLVLAATGCAIPRTVSLPRGWTVEDARGRLFIASGFVNDAPVVDTWRH
jgi:hypothetical protein